MVQRAGAAARSGGRRALTKLQNRETLLTAAREVFAELGYEAASVRDIIGRTGARRRHVLQLLPVVERGLVPAVDVDYLTAAVIGVAREIGERMLAR